MLNPTPLSLALIEAANKLADEELLASIREIIDVRFSGHRVRSVGFLAEDIDPLLDTMIGDLPSDLPSYEDICADANRRCGTMDLRA